MSLSKFTTDVDNIQGLSNKPNEIEGLTADQLKKKFDDASIDIKQYINETLTEEIDTGLETLNNKIDDELKTKQNNNGWQSLVATVTFASADAPTYVVTTDIDCTGFVGLGNRIKLTQTTTKYFIVTAITTSSITMYGGTDYTLTSDAISNVYYSIQKAPFGFPLNQDKWSVIVYLEAAQYQTNPVAYAFYNIGNVSITMPIGEWKLITNFSVLLQRGSAGSLHSEVMLSNSSTTADAATYLNNIYIIPITKLMQNYSYEEVILIPSKITRYLLFRTVEAGLTSFGIDYGTRYIKLVSNYL